MFYIHQASCVSPQQTFTSIDIDHLHEAVNNKLQVIEPSYEGIPTGILRRMGKAIRIGVGAAMPLIKEMKTNPDGIIIGTANGGMEDCIRFLNQIIDYDEGLLTPTNFVQSTTNAIAAQIGLLSTNKAYNTTHVHRGLAFENALLDAGMQLKEQANASFLAGGVDEISAYNFNIDYLDGWYKKESIAAASLYASHTPASIAGEGAAMFLVNNSMENAMARLVALQTIHTASGNIVTEQLQLFLKKQLAAGEKIDILLTGENGDSRMLPYYLAVEGVLDKPVAVARFKHMTGEYPTCSAAALWLMCKIIKDQKMPGHMIKYASAPTVFNRILLYNNYKGVQHSFMLVERS